MRIRRRRGERGLTVVEVLVAVILFSVGLGATGSLILVTTGQSSLSKHGSDAATLAEQEIEIAHDQNFASMVAGTITTTYTVGTTVYTVTRTTTINDPSANVNRVRVAVTWGGWGVTNANTDAKRFDTESLVTSLQ